ncbi:hypothetical protein BDV29DRAFT_196239 [Aspergillus leporis]|uniref:Alpha/Beta hydrolase protein n=1 Tax=Aspergillus leporis TaxID=41062 RepID=A0A5N5WGZ6_9EURO|nr:hypothetical protein BDV29DRAFT_196239 [Aspergillus leporis]
MLLSPSPVKLSIHAMKAGKPPLLLAIKQYTPVNNPHSEPDDITIIAGHVNGIPKINCCHQGANSITNWFDHSRDLLYMVNHFRDLIITPVVRNSVHLSVIHPRLFHTLVFLEPIIQVESPGKPGGHIPAPCTSSRPNLWKSRSDAESYIRKNSVGSRWNARAVDRYIQFVPWPTPTVLYPSSSSGAVTLTTTKTQEAWTYLRFNVTPQYTDDDPDDPRDAFKFLSYVLPSALFIFGDKSHINIPHRRKDKLGRIGLGPGGNRGMETGHVRADVLPGASHMMPLEKIRHPTRLISILVEPADRDVPHGKEVI